jgi:hypothetical protein
MLDLIATPGVIQAVVCTVLLTYAIASLIEHIRDNQPPTPGV